MARKMKDSGFDWIGTIPQDWSVWKLKYLLDRPMQYGANETGVAYSEELPRYVRITDITPDNKLKDYGMLSLPKEVASEFILDEGDILFTRSGATVGKTFIYKKNYGLCAFAGYLIRAITNEKILPEYIYYFTLSSAYESWKNRVFIQSTIQNIGADKYSNMQIAIPPSIEEQRKIVIFLENKLSEIDAIISKTRESIEEYKKYKQAVIIEAITQGLDKSVDVVNTDNIHIPQIPAHWKMKKMKYIFEIKKDIAGKEGYDILSITQKGIKIKDISRNEGQLAQNYSNYQLVDIGDFAMNHMDLLTGWVDISKYAGVTSPDYRVFRFIDATGYDADYYLYLMQMCYMNRIFYGLGQGVSNLGRWRLQADKFLNFTIPEPPLKEQQEIAKYLSARCIEIDTLIAKKESFVEEMEAYKKSLIYEYVTGKKELF